MRSWWSWLGLNLGKRAGAVALIGLFVTLVLGLGMTSLHFVTSNSSYLNRNDPAEVDNSHYENIFGGDFMATTFTMTPGHTIDDLFTPHNIAAMTSVETRLREDHWVFDVIGPMDALNLANRLISSPSGNPTSSIAAQLLLAAYARTPAGPSKTARLSFMEKELAEEGAIPVSERVFTNPQWVGFLLHNPSGSIRTVVSEFFPNNSHASMYIVLKGHLNISQEARAAHSVLAIINSTHFQNATVMTTGVPELLETINNYLKGGMLTLTAIAGAIMALVLLLFFTVRWRLLPFIIVAIGLIWAFGLVGYFGIPLTLGSIAGLPTLLGIGMDYSIQMHSRIEEEVVLDRAQHPIQASARNLGPALLVVTVDAVLAFLALMFAKVPMIRQFGELLVVGIVAVCVFSIIGTLSFLGIREYRSPTQGRDFSRGRLSRMVVKLGSLSPRFAVPFAAASVVIFAAGLAVGGHIHLQTDPIQWINPHSKAGEQISQLRKETGADDEFGVMVSSASPFSTRTVDYISELSHQEATRYSKDIFPGMGLVNLVDQTIAVPGATRELPTGSEVAEVYHASPPAIQREMVGDGGHAMNVVFRVKTSSITALGPVVHRLEEGVDAPAGIKVMPGGIAVIAVGLLDNLASSRTLLTYLALIFVGLWLAIRLRSVVRSLLSLVPVLIAVGGVAVIAWAFSLRLSPMTAVSGPLVVAACTEFTSLILLRFVEERHRGLEPRPAADEAARRTGRAFMVSGMTAVVGIGVMATSSMPLLQGFGILVALNVAVALLAALVVLPPILVWAERWNLVTKGLPRYEEPERRPLGQAGYQSQPAYQAQPGYQPQPVYYPQPAHSPQPVYHPQPGHSQQPLRQFAGQGVAESTQVAAAPSPGWYRDPLAGYNKLRYWNGASWTYHVADVPPGFREDVSAYIPVVGQRVVPSGSDGGTVTGSQGNNTPTTGNGATNGASGNTPPTNASVSPSANPHPFSDPGMGNPLPPGP
jgi:hydrophobe/amphiphile efflux-3 (HAE3) family protein